VRIQKADNGLYQAKLALAGVGQNELLIESTSGILQGNIESTSGILQGNIESTSGILQGNIESTSGTLDGNINTVSGDLNTVSSNVDKLLNFSRFETSGYRSLGSTTSPFQFITTQNVYVVSSDNLPLNTIQGRNTIYILNFCYSSVYTGAAPSCSVEYSVSTPDSWIGLSSLPVQASGETYSCLQRFNENRENSGIKLRFRVTGASTLTSFSINLIQGFAITGPPESGY